MKKTIRKVAIVFLCLFVSCVHAESQWFQVEVIVFAQTRHSNETFDQTASHIAWPTYLQELTATPLPLAELQQVPEAFVPLQSADRSLTTAYQTLQLQSGYRPLLHQAWVQPVNTDQVGDAVHIHATGMAGEGEILNGFVQLDNNGGLSLLADLEYTPAAPDGARIVYRLRERRRVQPNETHYLDHPKFGVISRVSPLQ